MVAEVMPIANSNQSKRSPPWRCIANLSTLCWIAGSIRKCRLTNPRSVTIKRAWFWAKFGKTTKKPTILIGSFALLLAVPTGNELAERNYKRGSRWDWFMPFSGVFFYPATTRFYNDLHARSSNFWGLGESRDTCPLMSKMGRLRSAVNLRLDIIGHVDLHDPWVHLPS